MQQCQIVRERDEALTVRVVPRAGAGTDLPQRVTAAFLGELEEAGVVAPVVRCKCVAEIEREPGHAAKLKLVMSAR